MGKTSAPNSKLNLPGRYAWSIAESVGPINLLYILYSLPRKFKPEMNASSSLFGTGLPIQHEIMGMLYVLHYVNRAFVTPILLAPSMSPIHLTVASLMAVFQFMNSSSLAGWITYSARDSALLSSGTSSPLVSFFSVVGLSLYILGLAGNIIAETTLFDLRRGAAKRKAKSEGRAQITYDKVYVIPPAEGLFKYILYPHYTMEWVEWAGYWILGGAWGLGYGYGKSAALWFLINELCTMLPRAWEGKSWYTKRFGAKAVAGRKSAIPGVI